LGHQVRLCVCVCVCARRCGIHKALHARTLSVCTLRSKTVHAHMHHCACCLFCLAISLPDDGAPAKQPPQEQTRNYFQRAYAFQTEKVDAVCVCVCLCLCLWCVCVCVCVCVCLCVCTSSFCMLHPMTAYTHKNTHAQTVSFSHGLSLTLYRLHTLSLFRSVSLLLSILLAHTDMGGTHAVDFVRKSYINVRT
jgi:hypothetical protein